MMNENPDELDHILDAALRDYSNAEPPAGIENRILRHIETVPRRRSGWKLGWAVALAAAGLIVWFELPEHRSAPASLALLPPPVPAPLELPAPGPAPQPVRTRRSPRREDSGLFAVTPEERVLVRFVQEQPAEAVAALSRPAEFEALAIEPLKIKELE